MSEDKYNERYCAYIDILGFSEIIASLDRGGHSAEQIRELFKLMTKRPPHEHIPGQEIADLRIQSISDAICISASLSTAGLTHLLTAIESLAGRILRHGYFIRGAVVKGQLYHDDHAVFGSALVRAYNLESNTVRYPRVMVTNEVVRDIPDKNHGMVGSIIK